MVLGWVAAILAVVVILWTLLPLLRHDAWWIRVFDFPRIQVTVVSAVVLLSYASLVGWQQPRDLVLLVTLAGCIVFQLVSIARYTPLYPRQLKWAVDPRPDNTLSLLMANVLTPNRNADALLRLIEEHNPDIVIAVETDEWWESKLDALEPDYRHTIKHPLDNLYGMHVYSRLELLDTQVLFLVEDDVPSMHADVVLRSGHRVELHCLHPAPPTPTENPSSAERDAELLVVAKTLDSDKRSVVVIGDLNDVAWSATTRLFQNLSGLLDPRIGRGLYSTFHAKYPFMRWPLDHVFCSRDFTLVSIARLGDIGSDHFPIHAVLHHAPRAQEDHEKPAASDVERAWAESKIEKADADADALRSGRVGGSVPGARG